jgi:RNA polymerase sigma factor (sigma-70 family)
MSRHRGNGHRNATGAGDDACEIVRRIQAYLCQLREHAASPSADSEEWNRLFRQHLPFFESLVRGRHWSVEDREDGVQELWLTIITRLPDLHFDPSRGDLNGWIATVARHWLVDQLRYRRARAVKRLDGEAADQLAGREPDPTATVERSQVAHCVQKALADLRGRVSDADYEAFTLHWLGGLRVREIAERLGKTEAQVWASHHRVREKLRPLLEHRLGSDH